MNTFNNIDEYAIAQAAFRKFCILSESETLILFVQYGDYTYRLWDMTPPVKSHSIELIDNDGDVTVVKSEDYVTVCKNILSAKWKVAPAF